MPPSSQCSQASPTGIEPEPEVHIAGLLVQTRPSRSRWVATSIATLPQAEVSALSEDGKLVVVCECDSSDETVELIGRIRDLPGVLNVALVYQHAESAQAMEEEIDHENDPS